MSSFDTATGKITQELFGKTIFSNCGKVRKEVLVPPKFGVDTSIIDIGHGQVLAVTSDPLSLIPAIGLKASAWLSVHLLANDMATTGFSPQYAQFVLNLPTYLTADDFNTYWNYIHLFCEEIGVAITGGHTGKIEGQNSTISGGGTMFLTAPKAEVIASNTAQQDNVIVVTKGAALASSSILSLCFPETVKDKIGVEKHEKSMNNFYRTSSLKEACLAKEVLKPNKELVAMHDVTEGGIMGAIHEMAMASGCGFNVATEKIPVAEEVQSVCNLFDIDPKYCIGAGSMIMAIAPGSEDKLINHLKIHGIESQAVGKFTSLDQGTKLTFFGDKVPFIKYDKDPYWEAFFSALKAGLK